MSPYTGTHRQQLTNLKVLIMKKEIKYTPAATFDEALAKSAEIAGMEFYQGFENCYEPDRFTPEALNNDRGFFVCQDTGDIYYVYKNVTKDGRYGAGEEILHKLSIHTSIGSGPFSAVFIYEELELDGKTLFWNQIDIIYKDWDRCQENRKHFANMGQIVTTL
jgi:hypothetical protein